MTENGKDSLVNEGKNIANLEELKEFRRFKRLTVIENIITKFIGILPFLVGAWCLKDAIIAFAGKETAAYIKLLTDITTNIRMDEWIAYLLFVILGGGGSIFAYKERKLRKEKVTYLAKRLQKYENIIDPNRTSSNLHETGDTKIGD